MLRSSNHAWNNGYPVSFLSMVTPERDDNTVGYFEAPFPSVHPNSEKNWEYATLGVPSANWVFPVFAHLDSTLVYFENAEGEQDSVYFPLGDAEHNVLDPERGWNLETVFDNSGVDLGFQTRPDTLTIVQGESRFIPLKPKWNDENVSELLYNSGSFFIFRKDLFPSPDIVAYKQNKGPKYPETDLGVYAVAINGIDDAFAMDYILVQFVEELEVPSLNRAYSGDTLKLGVNYSISLKGDLDKMTSWEPTIIAPKFKVTETENYNYVFQPIESGSATITLSHKNALRQDLEDQVIEVFIEEGLSVDYEEIALHPNPASTYVELPFIINSEITISDLSGNAINLKPNSNKLDLSGLVSGTYFIEFEHKNKQYRNKIVKR
jgi:hypothetical protein